MSADSGLDEAAVQHKDFKASTVSLDENVTGTQTSVGEIRKTSTSSLPTDLVKESGESKKETNKWKTLSLFRTFSRPELFCKSSEEEEPDASLYDPNPTRFLELLMEAMMILDEVEACGTTFCFSEDQAE